MQLAKFDLHIASFGNRDGVFHCVRHFAEKRGHLLGTSQEKLLRRIAHAVGVAQVRLGADANQRVVRVRMFALQIMHVICSNQIQAKLFRPWDELPVYRGLFVHAMILQLQIKPFLAEDLPVPVQRVARLV